MGTKKSITVRINRIITANEDTQGIRQLNNLTVSKKCPSRLSNRIDIVGSISIPPNLVPVLDDSLNFTRD